MKRFAGEHEGAHRAVENARQPVEVVPQVLLASEGVVGQSSPAGLPSDGELPVATRIPEPGEPLDPRAQACVEQIEALKESTRALEQELSDRAKPIFDARFSAGLYEVLEQPIKSDGIDRLCTVRFRHDGTAWRATLSESEYPAEHAIWQQLRAELREIEELESRLASLEKVK
jgi:hypothetical protein